MSVQDVDVILECMDIGRGEVHLLRNLKASIRNASKNGDTGLDDPEARAGALFDMLDTKKTGSVSRIRLTTVCVFCNVCHMLSYLPTCSTGSACSLLNMQAQV